jgi:hypothetical protein
MQKFYTLGGAQVFQMSWPEVQKIEPTELGDVVRLCTVVYIPSDPQVEIDRLHPMPKGDEFNEVVPRQDL